MSDYFDLFVNNELEETDLTEDEVQEVTAEIMEEDPGAVITIEPAMIDADELLPDDLEDDFYDEDEDEGEEDEEDFE